MSPEVALLLSPFVLAMLALSIWGWARVPNDARFRGRLGPTGTDFTVGKGTGFAMRLISGIFIWFGSSYAAANGWSFGQAMVLGAVGLSVMLIGQISAIRRASV